MMENRLEEYIGQVEQYLRPLSATERSDIIEEIRNHIMETHISEQKALDAVIDDLEDPRDLARAYGGEAVANHSSFNLRGVFRVLSFYSLNGLSGMVVIPSLAVTAGALYFSACVVLAGGVVKWGAALMGIDMPYIRFDIGGLPDIMILPIALLVSAGLYLIGRKLWKVLRRYLRGMSDKHLKFKRRLVH